MSNGFENFLNELLTDAKSALTFAAPVVAVVEQGAGVVAAIDPAVAPAIASAEAGVAAITAIVPTAVDDTLALITRGEQLIADLGPAALELSSIFGQLFNKTTATAAQAIVLVPATSAPTVAASLVKKAA